MRGPIEIVFERGRGICPSALSANGDVRGPCVEEGLSGAAAETFEREIFGVGDAVRG
jgi:hypothetical protein